MNKYKLTTLISDPIKIININNNIPYKISLSEGRLYYLRKLIRDDHYQGKIIEFKSELSIEEISEILNSEDIIITKMFIDMIKNTKI